MKRKLAGKQGNRPLISGRGSNVYFLPESLAEAVNLLGQAGEGLKVLAGGTDLLVDFYERLVEVEGWLDLGLIPELREIKIRDEQIEIGAMVTHAQLEKSENIKKTLPVLAAAAAEIGSPQIRNRGTIGGNVVTASPAGDLLAPLIAYNAVLELVGKDGVSRVPAGDFFSGPKQTIMKRGQLLSRVLIPRPSSGTIGCWIKIGKRKALVIASISLALVVRLAKGGVIADIRACFGAVAPTPLEIKAVRRLAGGKRLEQLDFSQVGELAAAGIAPIDDLRGTEAYRRNVARELLIQALEKVQSTGGEIIADQADC